MGKFEDLTGQKFGKLTVLGVASRELYGSGENGRKKRIVYRWSCRCDCGGTKVVAGFNLKSGQVRSCNCLLGEANRGKYKGQVYPDAARRKVLDGYIRGAKTRGVNWSLLDEDFDEVTSGTCYYCGEPPSKIQKVTYKAGSPDSIFIYNGIDRVNNDIGYVPGNVVPCCTICNFAKCSLSFREFMGWVARLVKYQSGNPGLDGYLPLQGSPFPLGNRRAA